MSYPVTQIKLNQFGSRKCPRNQFLPRFKGGGLHLRKGRGGEGVGKGRGKGTE